ncbi:MAG: c-type cytochrome, partial [Woeseiaceae bacterium]
FIETLKPCFNRHSVHCSPNIHWVRGVFVINNRAIFGTLCVAFVFYSGYVYTKGTEAAHLPPMNDVERHGADVFQDYNCIACHQFYGLGGYMGPDLTNVISNRGEAVARAFIAAGTATMPNLGLAPEEVEAVVAYLKFVDKTGTYPPENYEVRWYGAVDQEDDPQ